MATLINWSDDLRRKRLQPQGLAGTLNSGSAGVPRNTNLARNSARNTTVTPAQLVPLSAQRSLSTMTNPQNTIRNFRTNPMGQATFKTSTANTVSSPAPSSLPASAQQTPAPQLNLQNKNNTPKLNTLSGADNTTFTTMKKATYDPARNASLRPSLNPALNPSLSPALRTSLKQPNTMNNASTSQQADDNTQAQAAVNQAKERYNSLLDNNNDYWNKYQSALATTKDQYKDIFGDSLQKRSASQMSNGLKKMLTEDGSLPSTGEDFINKYRSLSNDDKWEVWQNLQKSKNTLTQAITKADNEGQEDLKNAFGTLLAEVSVYNDILANEDRGNKSFGKSFGDWMTSGGVVSNMAEPAINAVGTVSEALGNKGGVATARAVSQNNAVQNHGNSPVFDAVNFGANTVGNIAANTLTGGAYGLANAGLGVADSVASAITDRNRNYYADLDGNMARENQTTKSKLAGIGNSALSAGLTVAGMKGIGPNISFKDGQSLQSLLSDRNFSGVGKALGKYAAKELPWAIGTTAASQGISALGGDKNFTEGFGTELANNIVGDLAVDVAGAVRQGRNGNRDLFKPGGESDPSALQTLAKLGYKANDELNRRGGIGLTTKLVDGANQKPNLNQKAKSSLNTLREVMAGRNTLRPTYAGMSGDTTGKATNAGLSRNFTIIKGGAPDGSNLVKTDYNLSGNTSANKIGQAIRDVIGKRFQGKTYKVGNTATEASITAKTRNEMGYQQKNMSDSDFVKKGSMAGNLNELIENMQGIRKVKNHKTSKKPNVDHYISGRVAVDLGDGKVYYPRVDIEVSKKGNAIGYNIADIKEFPRSRPRGPLLSATKSLVDDTGTHSRALSIAQDTDNVNIRNDLKSYYLRYGSDFYDKMPENLQSRYDSLLDAQPRDRSGRYTDPITGEKWIDESVNSGIDTQKYVQEQVAAQKAENKTPIKQKAQDTIDNLKHYLVDDAVAYERYVKDKGERLNLREGVDRVRSSDTIARQMIEDSGLADAIGKMKTADADEFQQYLIAKRSQELKRTKGADFRTGRNDAADQALIKSVGNKYAEQEKVVREFNTKMLDYAVDTGLISKNLRNQLVKDNTDYVPMNRVLDSVADMGMHKSKQLGNLGKQTAVQKIEGSDRIVQNPLESMIRNAIRTVNEGERNKVAKQLSETAAFREARLPEGAKPKPGNDKLSFIVNGEKVSYEVPALVAKEMKNLNGAMPDFAQNIIKVLGAPTKVLRTGATSANPMFAVSNLVRDQLQTTITGNLKTNIAGTPKALMATFGIGKKGKAMQAELARQGIIGSEYRQTYGYKSGELVKELQQAHQLPKQAWQKLKHPIDTLADVIGKTEYFTRAQQYYGTKGSTAEKAQAARNNTLNFGRAGSTVRVLNKVIPFLNAGVQGGRITVKQFKERPVRTTMAVATFAGLAAAVRGMNSAQNQELWDRIGDEEKQSNLIIFGPDAHYDPETNRVVGVTKVPLPQMIYPITDAVNNLKGKPEDLMMLGGDIFTAVTGIDANNPVNQLLPTAVKPLVETAMNKNTYTGQEIVSEYDSNLAPEDKGKKYTTGVARAMAKATGVDAPIIDNFIQNWGGGLFKDLTKALADNPDNKSDGGGVGAVFSQGAFRRFMSASVESQYDIQATLAEDYKNQLKADPAFQALDANEQKKALDRIDADTKAIAGFAAKTEQGRENEITADLSKRQKALMQNGFDVSNYNRPSESNSGHSVEINSSIQDEYKKILDNYNSMDKEDWEKYLYTDEGRNAEYKLAAAKFENDKANGDLTEVQELKRKKELRKLKVSQMWNKDVRDAYSLAGSKTDMQALLNELDSREDMVSYLNAMNRAMYDAGVITASTYKTRNRNINNLESGSKKGSKSKSAYSNASKAALAAYTKALAGGNSIKVNSKAGMPSTSRRMNAVALATGIKKSKLGAQAKISVKKGIN